MPGSQTVTGGIWKFAMFWLLAPWPNIPLNPPKRATPITHSSPPVETAKAKSTRVRAIVMIDTYTSEMRPKNMK